MKLWLKIFGVLLLVYIHVAGLLLGVPRLVVLHETIRALYFHVPMWFGMMLLYSMSVFYAIRYLSKSAIGDDVRSVEYAHVGTLFGILGILSGMFWANFTWGSPWHGDVKQNMAAISILIYLAYFVLRGSLQNEEQKARLSAVYNIFAFVAMIPLLFIIPRMTSSMHPGSGGNPGFNMYDLDSKMRMVFYPAILGWFIVGLWAANLRVRYRVLHERFMDLEDERNG